MRYFIMRNALKRFWVFSLQHETAVDVEKEFLKQSAQEATNFTIRKEESAIWIHNNSYNLSWQPVVNACQCSS